MTTIVPTPSYTSLMVDFWRLPFGRRQEPTHKTLGENLSPWALADRRRHSPSVTCSQQLRSLGFSTRNAGITSATGSTQSAFPLFSKLPPELRNQIWQEALPRDDEVPPALFFYKKGCWAVRTLTEGDDGYIPGQPENNIACEFRHDKLDLARIELPLVEVNREARSIAFAWARDKGYSIRNVEDRPVILRPFDPARDVIYISPSRWTTFLNEPGDRLFEPDLVGRNAKIRAHLGRIAVPESFISGGDTFSASDWDDTYPDVRSLYIVIDPSQELDREACGTGSKSTRIPSYWRLQTIAADASHHGVDESEQQRQSEPWESVIRKALLAFQDGRAEQGNSELSVEPIWVARESVYESAPDSCMYTYIY
ncbi:hypothetical protein F5Y17DRAFT_453448 [Xylariaceae sp. FL0594]|nr:hypothetical protein F5Y17DRAFT_453448 [Xylariaceae sp. FL0594]